MKKLSYTKSAMTFLLLVSAFSATAASVTKTPMTKLQRDALISRCKNSFHLNTSKARRAGVIADDDGKRCWMLVISTDNVLVDNALANSDDLNRPRCAIITASPDAIQYSLALADKGKLDRGSKFVFRDTDKANIKGARRHNYSYCSSAWKAWCRKIGKTYNKNANGGKGESPC